MTKEQSLQLKGIAILFMIWGHLFGNANHVLTAYLPWIVLDGIPLVSLISRAMGPVAFFLILSGYGLFRVNEKGEDKHRWSRIWKLLRTYWIVLAIVSIVGYNIYPERYFNSFSEVLWNIVGLDPTYIPEAWFMLPYILLALTAPFELRLLRRVRTRYILLASFFLSVLTSYILSRFGGTYIYPNRCLYMLFCWFHFQFPFLLGMVAARCGWLGRLSRDGKSINAWYVFLMLVMLIALRCLLNVSVWHPIYVLLFVWLWTNTDFSSYYSRLLMSLGKYSTGMWFLHTSLGLYLFPSFFNHFEYPLFVFFAVTLVSFSFSFVIKYITRS